MAITNAQQAKQMQLVKKRKDGKRPGYYGADAGFGDDDYKDQASSFQDTFDQKTSGGGTFISDQDAQRVFDARPDLKEAFDNADKEYEKRKKEQEKADKERRAKERKEARKDRKKLTAKEKKKKRMQQAAFERFQKLEKYVDPFGDETTFAGMSGEDAARLAGYNVSEKPFGPPNRTTFDYDKDRFRDPKTGKIKDELTEMVNINEGKTDIFGRPKKAKFVEQIKPDAIPGYDFSINPVRTNKQSGLGTLTSTSGVRPDDYGLQMSKPPGLLGLATDVLRPETGLQAFNTLEEARNIQDLTTRFAGGDDSAYDEFEDYINRNKIPVSGGGRDDTPMDPCLGPNPPAYCFPNQDPQDPTPKRNLAGLSPRIGGSIFNFDEFAAEGGRIGAMDGGIMNVDDLDREAFLLGGIAKGLKKAVRGVKKIAKSPLGKAALIGAGFGLAGMGPFKGLAGTSFGKGLAGLRGTLFGQAGSRVGEAFVPYKEGLFTKLGLTKGGGSLIPTFKGGITLASILPLLVGKTDEEKDQMLKDYYASQELSPATTARQAGSEFDFYQYNLAEGGSPRKEPVAKKVMPLLDMGGMEKDYRAEGGFVPIGRMEKADDVPARLSKNEFVFTADAVRNAGDGDVDKGAEVMYNMMKNLEAGGEVSEESQGLDGAREMFQTSQRLGEVI
jgi:hypothetical protein